MGEDEAASDRKAASARAKGHLFFEDVSGTPLFITYFKLDLGSAKPSKDLASCGLEPSLHVIYPFHADME